MWKLPMWHLATSFVKECCMESRQHVTLPSCIRVVYLTVTLLPSGFPVESSWAGLFTSCPHRIPECGLSVLIIAHGVI